MSCGSLAQAAPGRFAVGIGSSSNVIVEHWNGIPFEKPYARVRDTVRFLRRALRGEKISEDFETFSVKNFRLGIQVDPQPPILVAALREGMLRLAGREGDGAIINWLSADDVKTVAPIVHAAGGPGKEIVARIFVCPNPDTEKVRAMARLAVNAYLNVPVYAAFHEWLGREGALSAMWKHWREGDRKAARGGGPRPRRRRADRARLARAVPRAHRALRRERRDHARDRSPAARRRCAAGVARSRAALAFRVRAKESA
jgi:alkanesulfonate monooxygenase SsuD/methylene tetrahydromethanopterin reductase-like flavin-dependent oxidoreductase (luciferase family)